jgi:hypothetical protein
MGSDFDRALNAAFVAKLAAEARHDGWWADVLADPKLVIAPRGSYLNVYWRGQSLFCLKGTPSGLRATTHAKYLIDPNLASQVALTERNFDISTIVEKGFIRHYEGPATLAKMNSAAGLFSGLEKSGCHDIAVRNPGVIDCEIAFPGKVFLDDGGDDKQAPRIDLAALEELPAAWPIWTGAGSAKLTAVTGDVTHRSPSRTFETWDSRAGPFAVGPFTVTPILTDHSAFGTAAAARQ